MKNLIFGTIVVVISLTLAFLLGEMIIRILYGENMNMFPRYHTAAEYGPFQVRKIRPDSEFIHTSKDGVFWFKTNHQGFRNDKNTEYAKPAGVFRVLTLGDSHTQGYEVNQHETYAYVCEQVLQKKGLNAEVINAGVSGFSTAEALVFLENEGLKYQPDAVILGFFANDYADNLKDGLYTLQNDSLINTATKFQPGIKIQDMLYQFGVFRYLGEHSYLYSFAFNAVWNLSKEFLIQTKKAESAEKNSTNPAPEEKAVSSGDISTYEINLSLALLQKIHTLCREKNIPFILADIPQLPFKSSIPAERIQDFKSVCDTLLYTNDLEKYYRNLKFTHVPHGHNHISRESHALLGVLSGEILAAGISK